MSAAVILARTKIYGVKHPAQERALALGGRARGSSSVRHFCTGRRRHRCCCCRRRHASSFLLARIAHRQRREQCGGSSRRVITRWPSPRASLSANLFCLVVLCVRTLAGRSLGNGRSHELSTLLRLLRALRL